MPISPHPRPFYTKTNRNIYQINTSKKSSPKNANKKDTYKLSQDGAELTDLDLGIKVVL